MSNRLVATVVSGSLVAMVSVLLSGCFFTEEPTGPTPTPTVQPTDEPTTEPVEPSSAPTGGGEAGTDPSHMPGRLYVPQ
jgi:hypothetical protein